MKIYYNENSYNIELKENLVCGEVQELILKKCSLMIYNIEFTEVHLRDGKKNILGLDNYSFSTAFINDLENEVEKFVVLDRLRDEKGYVIKENKVIDKYNDWYINYENERYLRDSRISYNNINNQNNNPFVSIFSNLNDTDYITNIFRNYVNRPSNEPVNNTPEEHNPNTINIVRDVFHNNEEEFNNLVNIFDRYINNQASQAAQSANLYNHFMNIYNNVNQNLEENENEEEESNNNNETTEQESNKEEENNENEPEREELTEEPILSIFDIFRNPNVSVVTSEIFTTETPESITFNIPIDFYQSNHIMEDVVVSLTEEEFNGLTCMECNKGHELLGKECGICMDAFEESNQVINLKCSHNYHKDCIKTWLCTRSTKCPVCREEVARGRANINF